MEKDDEMSVWTMDRGMGELYCLCHGLGIEVMVVMVPPLYLKLFPRTGPVLPLVSFLFCRGVH